MVVVCGVNVDIVFLWYSSLFFNSSGVHIHVHPCFHVPVYENIIMQYTTGPHPHPPTPHTHTPTHPHTHPKQDPAAARMELCALSLALRQVAGVQVAHTALLAAHSARMARQQQLLTKPQHSGGWGVGVGCMYGCILVLYIGCMLVLHVFASMFPQQSCHMYTCSTNQTCTP